MARPPAKVIRSQRFASRRKDVRKARQRRRRRMTFTVAALLVVGTGGWMFARSSLFALEGIEVAGTKLLSRTDIIRASGLKTGNNMLSLDLDAIETRISRLPLVRTVDVSKSSPSRVRIIVTERTPAFVLETIEGRWHLDADAVVLGPIAGAAPTHLPTVRLSHAPVADAGDTIRSADVGDALTLWGSLPESLRDGSPVIDAAEGALTLHRQGLTIRFGSLERIAEKLEAVVMVFERARTAKERLSAIDVRSPGRPAAVAA